MSAGGGNPPELPEGPERMYFFDDATNMARGESAPDPKIYRAGKISRLVQTLVQYGEQQDNWDCEAKELSGDKRRRMWARTGNPRRHGLCTWGYDPFGNLREGEDDKVVSGFEDVVTGEQNVLKALFTNIWIGNSRKQVRPLHIEAAVFFALVTASGMPISTKLLWQYRRALAKAVGGSVKFVKVMIGLYDHELHKVVTDYLDELARCFNEPNGMSRIGSKHNTQQARESAEVPEYAPRESNGDEAYRPTGPSDIALDINHPGDNVDDVTAPGDNVGYVTGPGDTTESGDGTGDTTGIDDSTRKATGLVDVAGDVRDPRDSHAEVIGRPGIPLPTENAEHSMTLSVEGTSPSALYCRKFANLRRNISLITPEWAGSARGPRGLEYEVTDVRKHWSARTREKAEQVALGFVGRLAEISEPLAELVAQLWDNLASMTYPICKFEHGKNRYIFRIATGELCTGTTVSPKLGLEEIEAGVGAGNTGANVSGKAMFRKLKPDLQILSSDYAIDCSINVPLGRRRVLGIRERKALRVRLMLANYRKYKLDMAADTDGVFRAGLAEGEDQDVVRGEGSAEKKERELAVLTCNNPPDLVSLLLCNTTVSSVSRNGIVIITGFVFRGRTTKIVRDGNCLYLEPRVRGTVPDEDIIGWIIDGADGRNDVVTPTNVPLTVQKKRIMIPQRAPRASRQVPSNGGGADNGGGSFGWKADVSGAVRVMAVSKSVYMLAMNEKTRKPQLHELTDMLTHSSHVSIYVL